MELDDSQGMQNSMRNGSKTGWSLETVENEIRVSIR